ncbi:transposase [Klebsiella pneumoniae]|nr:transposase [Klebsiella pneumoniae]
MHRLGEIRDRGLENQSYRASGLTLLDCGDLTVEYGLYRKSNRFFETKRDPAK